MMKGLMDRCIYHETVISRLREKLGTKEMEVQKLLAWKDVQVGKLDLTKQLLKELEAQVEALKKILKEKEGKIMEVKGQLRQKKEDAIKEYRDFDNLLRELGGSFAGSFYDCFRQVKASFLDLDVSRILIDVKGETPAHPTDSEGTDELFAEDMTIDLSSDGEAVPGDKEKSVEDGTHQLEDVQNIEEKNEVTPTVQQQFFLFSFYLAFLSVKMFWKNSIYV